MNKTSSSGASASACPDIHDHATSITGTAGAHRIVLIIIVLAHVANIHDIIMMMVMCFFSYDLKPPSDIVPRQQEIGGCILRAPILEPLAYDTAAHSILRKPLMK